MRHALLAASALLALTSAAHAQTPGAAVPPPVTKAEATYETDLASLSRVLGGAHYLRILCSGRTDQTWRTMMRKFMDLEGPPGTPRREMMVTEFNAGYRGEEERFPDCSPAAQSVEAGLKSRGARLASGLRARYRD